MPSTCIAFDGPRRLAAGPLPEVAAAAKAALDRDETKPILLLDGDTSEVVEVDFRGTAADVLARLSGDGPRKPGRPKLGVVPREVTLLPRHWDWLAAQPGGASVALRKLVEEARRANEGRDRVRLARESAYRFMRTLAGDEAGFEEATRALFAGDAARFDQHIAAWPPDLRDHARQLAAPALQ